MRASNHRFNIEELVLSEHDLNHGEVNIKLNIPEQSAEPQDNVMSA
jgi:hypothetical protein